MKTFIVDLLRIVAAGCTLYLYGWSAYYVITTPYSFDALLAYYQTCLQLIGGNAVAMSVSKCLQFNTWNPWKE